MAESNKVILVTGGSRGIGRAIAVRLAGQHRVAVTGRDSSALAETEAAVQKEGGQVLCLQADASNEQDVIRSVTAVQEQYGRIDVLINNAGMGIFRRADEFTLAEVESVFRANFFSAFLYTKYALPGMIERKRGQVINIASVAGLNGFKSGAAYAASKFAMVGFTESLREDVKQFGIAVTAVCPGGVRTEFGGKDVQAQLLNGEYLLEPDDVARTVEYLVEESETANAKMIELKPRRREKFRG